MDLENYKEAFKRGENIPFLLSKKKMIFWTIIFMIFACIGLWMLLPGSNGEVLGLACFLFFGYSGLLCAKTLFRRQMPPVISLNKDFLEIFLNPLNRNSSFISIQWSEILYIGKGRKGHKTYYLELVCIDTVMQKFRNLMKFNSGRMFRTYILEDNFILLKTDCFMETSLSDLLTLLKEFHKEATSQQQ